MVINEEMHIECPATTVFDLMADVRGVARWNTSVSQADMTSEEPIGEGSTFTTVNRGQQLQVAITTFERPERLVFSGTSKLMDITTTFALAESDGATTLGGTFDIRPKGIMSVLLPVLSPMVRRDLAKQHANFVALCEAEARSDDT